MVKNNDLIYSKIDFEYKNTQNKKSITAEQTILAVQEQKYKKFNNIFQMMLMYFETLNTLIT